MHRFTSCSYFGCVDLGKEMLHTDASWDVRLINNPIYEMKSPHRNAWLGLRGCAGRVRC